MGTAGADGPGQTAAVDLFGQADAPAAVFGSFEPGFLDLPTVLSTSVWIDPAKIFFASTTTLRGLDVPARFEFTHPSDPSLTGLEVHFQGGEIQAGGTLIGTSVAPIVFVW